MKLLVFILSMILLFSPSSSRRKNSHFYWKKSMYVMPWLKGPNVCAVEEVMGSGRRYYSECMMYTPRRICQKPTFIRYHCCAGFERASDDDKNGCRAVAPVQNLYDTAKRLYLREFRHHAKTSALHDFLRTEGPFTLFVPENKAFLNISQNTKNRLLTTDHKTNLIKYHMTRERRFLADLQHNIKLPTLYKDNPPIKVSRYANGIVTANCARLIIPDQMAANGIMHIVEKVIEPVSDKGNLMEVLLKDDRFGELVTAMIVTQLGGVLRDNARFLTIFAPTDAAFRNAPPSVVERILQDKNVLQKLLRYHMVEYDLCSAAILGRARLPTLEGQRVNLSCGEDDRMYVNGKAASQTDILASNGIVHVLDDVLIPDSAKSLHEVILEQEHFEFLEYAQQAGVSELLDGGMGAENFTIFVPHAKFFANMSSEEKRSLQSSQKRVRDTISYHVAPGRITTHNLRGRQAVTSHTDKALKLRLDVIQGGFSVNGARILSSDHESGNGVVHVIDRMLRPPSDNARWKLRQEPAVGTFRALMDTAGMDAILTDDEANFTIFAPNDVAFDKMDSNRIERFVHDRPRLRKFLSYHILTQPVYTSLIRPRLEYRFRTQIPEEWIHIRQEEPGAPFLINKSLKILSDPIEATNGVIYMVDGPLECSCLRETHPNEV